MLLKKTYPLLYVLLSSLSAIATPCLAHVTLVLDYGTLRPKETHVLPWEEGLTVQLALQHCASVETHPVGKWIFIQSINGLHSQKNGKVWYYFVNTSRGDKMAYRYVLSDGDLVEWRYLENVCSGRSRQS